MDKMESDNASVIKMFDFENIDESASAFESLLSSNYQFFVLNDKGQTVLHLIFYKRAWEHFELLDEKFSSSPHTQNSIDFTDCNGLTHLHIACARGSLSLVERYLGNENINASYNTSGVFNGFTPLHFAVLNQKVCKNKIVTKLIEQGANVNAVDAKGRTPLHISSGILKSETDIELDCLQIMDILVKEHSDINAKDADGKTPLLTIFTVLDQNFILYYFPDSHPSAHMPEIKKKLQFLLDHGADITASNKRDGNILHTILENLIVYRRKFRDADYVFDDSDHIEMIKHILSANSKIDVNLKNCSGETPLQMAVACMSPKLVDLLLNYGADLSHLKIGRKGYKSFFYYPSMVVIFEPLQDLINVLDLLSENGYNFTLQDITTIFKFLLYEGNPILDFLEGLDTCYSLIKFILNYGSDKYVKNEMSNLYQSLSLYKGPGDPEFPDDYNDSFRGTEELYSDLMEYWDTMRSTNIFKNKKVVRMVRAVIEDVLYDRFDKPNLDYVNHVQRDFKSMKNVKFDNNVSLYDLLQKQPKNIPRSIVNSFDLKLIEDLRCYKHTIKGHITKARIRILFERYFSDCLKVICKSLPDICSRIICRYLSIYDIFNLSLAVTV